jgi:hypothetical protein
LEHGLAIPEFCGNGRKVQLLLYLVDYFVIVVHALGRR